MTILSAPRLHQLIDENVITALHENVNSASIDVRIGNKILLEDTTGSPKVVDLSAKESLRFVEIEIPEDGIVIYPGQCFLASTMEYFNLPNTLSCRFDLRSTIGRSFLEHMQAGYCDAGWHGAQLTMEFKNMSQNHALLIKPGMRVGQMVFFEHEDCGEADSYATKGSYNKQEGPTVAFGGTSHRDMA